MVGLDHKTYKCLPTQIIAQAQFPLAYIFLINIKGLPFFFIAAILKTLLSFFFWIDTALLKTLCLSEGDLAKKIVYIYIYTHAHNLPNKNITNIWMRMQIVIFFSLTV